MIWEPTVPLEARTRAPAAAAAAIHGTGHNVPRQRVRSGSPGSPLRNSMSYSQTLTALTASSKCASPADLAQPPKTPKTLSRIGSLPASPSAPLRPLTTSRNIMSPLESPRVSHKAEPRASNGKQPGSPLPGFKQQSQSTSCMTTQSQLVEQLQAFIGREVQACREALIAAQEAFKTNVMATLEARLEANSSRHDDSAKSLGDLEMHVRRLEDNVNKMDVRLNTVACRQLSKNAEQQLFETQVINFFEGFEESLQNLRQRTSSDEVQQASNSYAVPVEHRSSVESILEGSDGKLGTWSNHLSAAPYIVTERCNDASAGTKHCKMICPVPACGGLQQGNGSGPPSAGTLPPETSFRVEALEMALASMQQQEQERISRLQEKIRRLQKAGDPYLNGTCME